MKLSPEEMAARAEEAYELLDPCRVCPVGCSAHRLSGQNGRCGTSLSIPLASFGPHFGEESPLVGTRGSGTIFFGGCNLHCIFCQNSDISQKGPWDEVEPDLVARAALSLQKRGCHNIYLVSPTHVMPQLLMALSSARRQGLFLPVIYNSGGYESVEMLRLLDGVIDIYMPDLKYSDPKVGLALSKVFDYPMKAQEAIKEMHRQVGDLEMDGSGVALKGLLVRHLVLPDDLSGTASVARFLAREISVDTYVNIMGQYRPCHEAHEDRRLMRGPSQREMEEAFRAMSQEGLHRFDERPAMRIISF